MTAPAPSWYRRLLRALPFDFSSRFGAEMEETAALALLDSRGRRERTLVAAWLVVDLVRAVVAQHLDLLLADLRDAWRGARRRPVATVAVVLLLALVLGANTLVFSAVHALLVRPLPFPDAHRLVRLWAVNPEQGIGRSSVSPREVDRWSRGVPAFASVARWVLRSANLTGVGDPLRLDVAWVSPSFFGVLGVSPALGGGFDPETIRSGADDVVVLRHGVWSRFFGGRPDVVGDTIRLDGRDLVVVGVLGSDFVDPTGGGVDVFVPMLHPTPQDDAARWWSAMASLSEGVEPEVADAQLRRVSERLEQEGSDDQRGWGVELQPLAEAMNGSAGPLAVGLQGALMLVLGVAIVNLASVQMARQRGRQEDAGIRAALGARPGRLLRQSLTEHLLLAFCGGVLGVGLAAVGAELLNRWQPALLPRGELHLAPGVLVLSLVVCGVTGLVVGAAPAAIAFRSDVVGLLRQQGRGGVSGARRRPGAGLAVQTAIGVVLVAAAGSTATELVRRARVPVGVETADLLRFRVEPPWGFDPETGDLDRLLDAFRADRGRAAAFYRTLRERLQALPGVEAVGAVNRGPLAGPWWGDRAHLEGGGGASSTGGVPVVVRVILPGTLKTMGTPILAGRGLRPLDPDGAPVAVVDSALARRLPGPDPVGAEIGLEGPTGLTWFRVVGVIDPVRWDDLDGGSVPAVLVPFGQGLTGFHQDWGMDVLVRTRAGAAPAVASLIRPVVRQLDPDLPVFSLATLDDVVAGSLRGPGLHTGVIWLLSGLATLLVGVGIHGALAGLLRGCRPEVGLHLALGASPRRVVGRILGAPWLAVAGGLLLGGLAAPVAAPVVAGSVDGADPRVVLMAVAAVVLVGVAASWSSWLQLGRIDPATVLRDG